ncbi:hypothetical protein BvCmsSIP066_01058 [Escherichia coli]|jgi:hypothetical protein|nr:hypothetical protein BvCmsHHP012_03628 [Escherichia coli]GDK64160.1 hypothetical protein BvCmsKSP039_04527 [Escherichia coli]GDL53568.1 hypothetical protein BvCmsKSP015_02125 [Escherichia coli]GDV66890.1 hypothetical protein BvCmsSIP066_01058 [Escherichia coli]
MHKNIFLYYETTKLRNYETTKLRNYETTKLRNYENYFCESIDNANYF